MISKILKISFFILSLLVASYSDAKVLYNQKYLSVGVISNIYLPQFSENPNIRYMGTETTSVMNKNGGYIVLDKMLNLKHPSVEYLYKNGLEESTIEEREVAEKDISASPENILKSEGAEQLLKNNYYVSITPISDKNGDPTGKYIWSVYHIEIDDEIINQIYSNWNSSVVLNAINPPLKFIASGKIKEKNMPRIVFDISKKVGAFAIRGPIISNHPCKASINNKQGVRTGDKVKVYKTIEDKDGELYSKKIADGRCGSVGTDVTKINIISGRYPNHKNGDIATITGAGGWSLNVEGEYSAGSDYKITTRIFSEKLLKYYSSGISNYFIWGGEYGQFAKDPDKVWYEDASFNSRTIRPTMINAGLFLGYGLGYSFLTKFELIPFFTLGWNYYTMSGIKRGYIWDEDSQKFLQLSNDPNPDIHKSFMALSAQAGFKLAVNIFYPLQICIGTNFASTLPLVNPEEEWVTKRHDFNRLNVTVGLRYNF